MSHIWTMDKHLSRRIVINIVVQEGQEVLEAIRVIMDGMVLTESTARMARMVLSPSPLVKVCLYRQLGKEKTQ
jgi:hypothetical protein